MSKVEIDSREDIFFENYSKIINIEALTMIEMASRDIIPAVNAYMGDLAKGAIRRMLLRTGRGVADLRRRP
jgi:glutamine synthetase